MAPVVLVTGSTDGLGRAVAAALARQRARVLIHGRDPEKGDATLQQLRDETGNRLLRLYIADLAALAEVARLADEVARDCEQLHVLVNNAGVGGVPTRLTTADGYELHFAVNHLAHFVLTTRLLSLLTASAPARIVNISSAGQEALDFADLQLTHAYDPLRAYQRSKLAQILFTVELHQRLRRSGVTGVSVNALHPASQMDTRMVRDWFGEPRTPVEEGVEAVLRLALAPELEGVSGRYFEGAAPARPDSQAEDEAARRQLWELSEDLALRALDGQPGAW